MKHKQYRSRVLLRVVKPEIKSGCMRGFMSVVIPGWDHEKEIFLKRTQFPNGKGWQMRKDYRFFGHANTAAEKVSELEISGPYEAGSSRVPRFKYFNSLTGKHEWM